jgi:hypothetical protein
MVVVAKENGIEIHCDETGKFSASACGASITDRSLAKVKKWTATVKPTVTLMEVEPKLRYVSKRSFRIAKDVVEVARNRDGNLYGLGPNQATNNRRGYQTHYRNLFLPDEEAQGRMKALNEQVDQWHEEVDERYNAAFDEIVATLTPVDEENFRSLMAAKGGDDASG